jgi:hypothetical protein
MKLTNKLNKIIEESDPSCITKYTSEDNGHKHEYKIDAKGNGFTTFTIGSDEHVHEIIGNIVMPINNHDHDLG